MEMLTIGLDTLLSNDLDGNEQDGAVIFKRWKQIIVIRNTITVLVLIELS